MTVEQQLQEIREWWAARNASVEERRVFDALMRRCRETDDLASAVQAIREFNAGASPAFKRARIWPIVPK